MTGKSRFTRVLSAFTAATAITALALVAPATAAEGSTAGKVDPRPSTAKLAWELHKLQLLSLGRVSVREIGRSNQGRPVWSARVGHGPLRISYLTQQHGDEPLGTPAALEFLRELGTGNSAEQRRLRSQVTVDIVVRANPDGFEHDWRYNYAPDADPEYGERGKGYDINRYHDPAVRPEDNPSTESGLLQRHNAKFKPSIVVDYHMQGRYRDDEGKPITASVLWPTHPGVTRENVAFAKQISVVAKDSLNAAGGNVSQYPGGNYQGIARNGYGLLGSGSVLVELSDVDPGQEPAQIRGAQASMLAIAETAADGSLREIDPALADQIPPRGEPTTVTTNAAALTD
ncbi:M14 family zinc carboxypeptidase [Amycolatopsis nigrescens]|uniref:M14 family zinc carboxypeptidase n=1 Tax=Amycolatopsis nigrescens TaxID=381445 RepID=UPI000366EA19|nr:M14 family zinc carboxypeptidase [Amycolatopsis nigrescens]